MSVLRNTLGSALGLTAQGLSLVSKVLETAARALRPDPGGEEASRGRKVAPVATPLLDDTPHVRTSESHIEELAAKPATQVVAAVSGLSTDELRLLTEYEMAHKNRRTVMTAIEQALTPTPNGSPDSDHNVVMPEAGGVPTSGTMRPR